MDIYIEPVTQLIDSIDWDLIKTIGGGFIAFTIIMKLRTFSGDLLTWWAVKTDKDIRIGSVYRFSTYTGFKVGVLTAIDFRYCRFKFSDHFERIPNRDLAYEKLQVVRINPGENEDYDEE